MLLKMARFEIHGFHILAQSCMAYPKMKHVNDYRWNMEVVSSTIIFCAKKRRQSGAMIWLEIGNSYFVC